MHVRLIRKFHFICQWRKTCARRNSCLLKYTKRAASDCTIYKYMRVQFLLYTTYTIFINQLVQTSSIPIFWKDNCFIYWTMKWVLFIFRKKQIKYIWDFVWIIFWNRSDGVQIPVEKSDLFLISYICININAVLLLNQFSDIEIVTLLINMQVSDGTLKKIIQ